MEDEAMENDAKEGDAKERKEGSGMDGEQAEDEAAAKHDDPSLASTVDIVDTRVANIASLRAAFQRLGVATRLVRDPQSIESAERLVLPGVGNFAAAIQLLQELRLVEPVKRRIEGDHPTLAICLGMQLLANGSEESPQYRGLDILPVRVERFSQRVQVPQLGWNDVEFESDRFPAGQAYFANSYRIAERPPGWTVAITDYDGPFVSAVTRGHVLACQFHPELSGVWGSQLLAWWLQGLPQIPTDAISAVSTNDTN